MFNLTSKLDYNLNLALKENLYKKYRVIIKCKRLFSSMVKKVSSFHDALIYPIEYCNLIVANLNKREIILISEYPEIEKIFFDDYLFLCGMSVSTANNYYKSNSNLKYTGTGVKVGIIDSGVYPHIDLTKPNNRISDFKDLINGFEYPYDDNGHGTAMAGIICGSGISSNNLYSGIALSSNIISYKAFDALGKGFASTILFSIEDIIKNYKEHNLKVLCLPFEMLSNNYNILSAFDCMFKKVTSFNIIPIVPTGSNDNVKGNLKGIATLENCITVAGVKSEKSIVPYKFSTSIPFSKFKKPNFASSCTGIVTLNSDQSYISEKNGTKLYPKQLDAKYKSYTGTSLSVAYVSAICALLFEYDPKLKIGDIISIINLCCTKNDEISRDLIGEGVINLNRILK